MPEFAEVNTQVRWLRERVTGWKVTGWGEAGAGNFPEYKGLPTRAKTLEGFFRDAVVQSVTQRGKQVVMRLSTGTLTSHLMFKGRWSLEGEVFLSPYKQHKEPPTEKSRYFWLLSEGRRLNFHEPEYKGKVRAYPGVLPGAVEELTALGPEIVATPETDPDFAANVWTAEHLRAAAGKTRVPIKALLLDQKKQSGIGNMYCCEALYRARVGPGRPSNSLSADEVTRVHAEAQAVVRAAMASGLDYATVLAVYKRELDPFGRKVDVSEVGGRDTYWVPAVQT